MEFDYKHFNAAVAKARTGVLLFLATYILLILVSLALIGVFAFLAYALLTFEINRVTIFVGGVAAFLSVLMAVLLFQFLRTGKKNDTSGWLKVTPQLQPELFQMIKEIVEKVGTQMPKQVYLTAEVNAAALSDSRLISLMLPSRKDLLIGLALVNTTTKQELKAVLAHEFGHFSQKSMRIGSFVYHANMVIHNVLFQGQAPNTVGEVVSYFGYAGPIATFVLGGIKHLFDLVLKWVYKVINLRNYALSREMEFHADHVAAKVAGGDQLSSALLRMDFASQTWSETLTYYNTHDTRVAQNIYADHLVCAELLRGRLNLPKSKGLAKLDRHHQEFYNRGSVKINAEWSTHPPTTERVDRMAGITVQVEDGADLPAWTLFRHAESIQKQMTQVLFKDRKAARGQELVLIDSQEFAKDLDSRYLPNHAEWGNLYLVLDLHPLTTSEIEEIAVDTNAPLSSILNSETDKIAAKLLGLRADVALLDSLVNEKHDLTEFQHEGKTLPIQAAKKILASKKELLDATESAMISTQKQVFKWMKAHSSDPQSFDHLQENLLERHGRHQQTTPIMDEIAKQFNIASNGQNNSTLRTNALNTMRASEKQLKAILREWLSNPADSNTLSESPKAIIENYCSNELQYFNGGDHHETNVNTLRDTFGIIPYWLSEQKHFAERDLLQAYLNVMPKKAEDIG